MKPKTNVEKVEILLKEMDLNELYHKVKPIYDGAFINQYKIRISLWIIGGMDNREIDKKLVEECHLNPQSFEGKEVLYDIETKKLFERAYEYRKKILNNKIKI